MPSVRFTDIVSWLIYYAIMFIDLDTLLRNYVMVVVTALPLSLFSPLLRGCENSVHLGPAKYYGWNF